MSALSTIKILGIGGLVAAVCSLTGCNVAPTNETRSAGPGVEDIAAIGDQWLIERGVKLCFANKSGYQQIEVKFPQDSVYQSFEPIGTGAVSVPRNSQVCGLNYKTVYGDNDISATSELKLYPEMANFTPLTIATYYENSRFRYKATMGGASSGELIMKNVRYLQSGDYRLDIKWDYATTVKPAGKEYMLMAFTVTVY
ncbi:hypothetical protein [uncultured Aurantimicrobium sp.]|uniref:hypothetical protein n=1 Tax=uncultured Aurantimicrobium sp. TaxID=1705357 RepID=UPI00260F675D|nr:hypothetical protein [uncultured Aurantimicrobium sp.]